MTMRGADQVTLCDFGYSHDAIVAGAARRHAARRKSADRIFTLYLLLTFAALVAAATVMVSAFAGWLIPIISKSVSLLAP